MITLTVQHYNGSPLPQTLTVNLDEMGGTVGRADTNHLVLPDPERTISRVHVQIVYRHGAYLVVDRGSNPVQLNGRPLGKGQEATLAHGDQLEIGGYAIAIESRPAVAISVPQEPGALSSSYGLGAGDPFGDFSDVGGAALSARTPAQVESLASFEWTRTEKNISAVSASGKIESVGGGIPEDWDPFATPQVDFSDPFANQLAQASQSPQALPEPMHATVPSLDALFGLGTTSNVGRELGSNMFESPVHAPNTSVVEDPLRSLQMAAQVVEEAVANDVSALQEPFFVASRSNKEKLINQVVAEGDAEAPTIAENVVLSWDDGAQEGRTVIRAKARSSSAGHEVAAHGAALTAVSDASMSAHTVMQLTSVTEKEVNLSSLSAADVGSENQSAAMHENAAQLAIGVDNALLAAFEQGLGISLPQNQKLTPELMLLVGKLLRDSTQGTVDLLVARAAVKREVRAEITMIAAKENNPLKFSPSAEVALNHLLSAPVRGFMPAALAMQDAYDDLRAHQFAFVAGMKAALEGVLARFDPQYLEGQLTQKSGLSNFLLGSRKARMWDLFIQLNEQITSEASDDFHELFGKEFLRAYEVHLDQLNSEK